MNQNERKAEQEQVKNDKKTFREYIEARKHHLNQVAYWEQRVEHDKALAMKHKERLTYFDASRPYGSAWGSSQSSLDLHTKRYVEYDDSVKKIANRLGGRYIKEALAV